MTDLREFASQDNEPGAASTAIAVVLARVVVPAYFFLGAVLKLVSGNPIHLPPALIQWTGAMGIDLLYVFRLSIAGELVVVGVMFFVPRLARLAGLCLLGLFLPVLIGDLILGASSCGCFGAVPVSPWITVVIDSAFFVGLWWFGRRVERLRLAAALPTWQVVIAGAWAILSFMIGFAVVGGFWGTQTEVGVGEDLPLPVEGFFMPVLEDWIGKPWSEVELAQWFTGEAKLTGLGTEYVMFFRKDCEHCHELMQAWFSGELPAPTLAVAVPEKDGYPESGVLPLSCPECWLTELPSGINWFLQTPVLVRVEDGEVVCAAESAAENPTCLDF